MKSALRAIRRVSRQRLAWAVFVAGLTLGLPAGAVAASADWMALSTTIFRSVGEVAGTSVTAVTQDRDGYLWVGGQGGLSRFDGYRFRSYRADRHSPDAIHDAYINVLHTDRRGRLWIGTNAGGLTRYDRATDRFVTYFAGPRGISDDSVGGLADDATGLWIGTAGGLDHRIDATGVFEHFHHDRRQPTSLPDDAIHALLCDDRGTLWVGTGSGLVRRDSATGSFVPVLLPTADRKTPLISTIIQDSEGQIWLGTDRYGVYVIKRGEREAHPARLASERDGVLLATSNIQSIGEVRPGEIWFGTADYGIGSLDVATRRMRWIHSDPALPTSLPQNLVLAIYRDRSGLVWVGTLSGLRRSDPNQTAISSVVVGSNRSAGIADSDVLTIFATANDRAWLGLANAGIDIVDATAGRIGSLRPDPARPQRTLPQLSIRAIAGFAHGPMYIGTARGLFTTGEDGHGLRRIPMTGQKSDQINCLSVVDGVLWIGNHTKGVWRFDRRTNSARRLEHTGLRNSRITVIAPASRGHLWVGTYAGLNMLDIRSGKVQPITSDDPKPERRSLRFIASLQTDRNGREWVGTFGDGIFILDHLGSDGRAHFTQLSTREGLPNDNVDSMLADRQGRIWVATDDGMAVVDPTTLKIRTMHRADGIAFSNYYLGARARLSNGDLLFGAAGGLTIIRPALVRDWSYAPSIVATDLRIGNTSVPPLTNTAPGGSPIEISSQANSLGLEFAALDFSAPEQNQYAYRLDGYDRTWNETDASRRLAAYTNLAPGTYTLEVRGSNRNGAWSPILTFPIRVLPAWYQTTVFRIFEVLATFALIAGMIRIRTGYLVRRERALQLLVHERTAELRETAHELRERRIELEQMAYRDALTNLPNRRLFAEEIDRLMVQAHIGRNSFVLLLIDLDRFKFINDSLGHDAGDALLREAAKRFIAVFRATDCVVRLGGDEFAVLLAGDHAVIEVDSLCQRVVTSLAVPMTYNENQMQTSASIGVAFFPRDGTTQDELYKSADTALYDAKRCGRNTWRYVASSLPALEVRVPLPLGD
jgi:diguanylate cyclase (GGDEF)-like protein